MPLIKNVAEVRKSKEAGSAELTIGAMLWDAGTFDRDKAAGVLFAPHDAAFAFKATLPRALRAGDTDVNGRQQHAPLPDIDLPI